MEVARVKVKVAVARLMVAVVVARARVAAARKRELLSRCEAMQRPRRCGGRCLRPRCGARAGRRCWRSLGGAGRLLRLHQVEQAQVEQRLIFRRLAVAQLRQRRLRVHCRVSWLHAALLRATQGETYKTLAKKANSRKHALASAPVPCLPPVLKLARAPSWRRKGMRGSGSGCCLVASAPASSFASSSVATLDRHAAVQARDARGCPVREPGSRCAPAKRPCIGSVLLGDLFPCVLAPNGLRVRWCLTSVAPHLFRRLCPGDDDGRHFEGGVIKGGPLQRAHGGGGARGGGEEGQRPSRCAAVSKAEAGA